MIGKITKGNSPAGALKYACEKEGGQLIDTNCASSDWNEIAGEMDVMAASNTRCEKHCIHITLSAPPGEKLSNEQWKQAAEITRRELGLDKNQYALVRHGDTDHDHAHLIVERVGPDGKSWGDSNERRRVHGAMRVVEKELGLQKVTERTPTKDGRFNQVRNDLRGAIKDTGPGGMDGFKREMDKRGYDVIENRQSTGRLAGLSIRSRTDGKTWKASELTRGGARSIEGQLDRQQKQHLSDRAQQSAAAAGRGAAQLGKAIGGVIPRMPGMPSLPGIPGTGGVAGALIKATTAKPKQKDRER